MSPPAPPPPRASVPYLAQVCRQARGVHCLCCAAYRAKLGMLNTVSKIRGQVKTTGYPQTEGLLGDCMYRYGRELGDDSAFGT